MTLPPLDLDDLTWASMTEAMRERIPAASGRRWTLHAPVDPGLTILELYAWLLEQRLYLLDQVPPALVRGVLRLLGVAGPVPAAAAGAVLGLAPVPGAPPLAAVPAGTELTHQVGGRRIVVTTQDETALVAPTRLRLLVGGADRTAELAGGVDLFDGDAGTPVDVVLDVPERVDPPADARFALLLELEASPRVAPSWSPAAVTGVPPPAELVWSYEAAPGELRELGSDRVVDGTGGLRRPGVVRLDWPAEWRPAAGAGAGTVPRTLRVTARAATFVAPPRLVALVPDAVSVRHCRDVVPAAAEVARLETQLDTWISLPGQTLDLEASHSSPGEVAGHLLDDADDVALALRERDGELHDWIAVDDLSAHGPADRVFVVDRDAGRLRFGDGLTGRLPVVPPRVVGGPARLRLRYRLGGGEEGNLGRVGWTCDAVPVEGAGAVPWTGGREREPLEQARARTAGELARPSRAVTVADIKTLALSTPGVDVARVHVLVGRHPATPCDPVPGAVTVLVVPGVLGDRASNRARVPAPMPDAGMLAAVRARLEAARLIGAEIFVRGPRYRQVRLRVRSAGPVADPGRLTRALEGGLALHLDVLAGGPAGGGRDFGEPLRPAELLGVAQRLAARTAVIDEVAIGLDDAVPDETCDDVAIADDELVVLTGLAVAAPPPGAAGGGLS